MPSEKKTVLIVDDMQINIRVLSKFLGDEYRVLFATTGQEALDLALDYRPDLILLDVVLPDLDGFEVCTRLKNNPDTQAIPVVFITAMDLEEDEARGLEVGGIDYITKPFSEVIIRARVRNHLKLRGYQDALENLSALDGLTGLPNRRQFEATLGREWRRATRDQLPVSLILADIDHFMEFNEHYGQMAGDGCLRLVGQTLASSVRRPADLVTRTGGEEFACILPETSAGGAVWVANQFKERVNALKIPHAFSPAAEFLTLSFGVATVIPQQGQALAELVAHAEERLFQAKRAGRNQIVS